MPTLVLALLLVPFWGQSAPTHFTIFISAPMRDGFFDTGKDVQDSIKDISGRLAKQKNVELALVDDRAKADVVLTVVERGVGSQAYGERVSFEQYYRGASLENTPMVANTYWVSTMMQVGQYRKEFTGKWTNTANSSMGAWGNCADQIAKNVGSWVAANAELIKKKD